MKTLEQIIDIYTSKFQAPTREQAALKIEADYKFLVEEGQGYEFIIAAHAKTTDEIVSEAKTKINDRGFLYKNVQIKNANLPNSAWNKLLFALFAEGFTLVEDDTKHRLAGSQAVALQRPDSALAENPSLVNQLIDDNFKELTDAAYNEYFDIATVEKFVADYKAEEQAKVAAAKTENLKNLLANKLSIDAIVAAAAQAEEVKTADLQSKFPDYTLQQLADVLTQQGYTKQRKNSGSVWVKQQEEQQ